MTVQSGRLFALIPAAGQSRRMGRPKLLLPFGSTTVIGRLVQALQGEQITAIIVLVHPDDDALAAEIRLHGALVVQPSTAPAEMRVSVQHLLDAVAAKYSPSDHDGWLLVPGDHPLVTHSTLRQLVAAWKRRPDAIVLPVCEGRRGHPTIFPWCLADRVRGLSGNVGVNQLLHRDTPIVQVPVDDPTILLDLDTPDDYERALTLIGDPP